MRLLWAVLAYAIAVGSGTAICGTARGQWQATPLRAMVLSAIVGASLLTATVVGFVSAGILFVGAPVLAGAIAGLALLGGGPAQAAELPAADRQFVDATVMQAMQSGRLPGVSVKLTGPKGDYVKTYGVSDLAKQNPMALDDHVRIAMIENTVDTSTGMVNVRANMPNENELLWPGTLVLTYLNLRNEDAVTVPSAAVQVSQTGNFVYVIKNNVAELRPVKVARTLGEVTVLESGVADGDAVVVDGHLLLTNGVRVAIRAGKKASS